MSFKKDLKGTSLPEKTVLFYIQKYFDDVQYNIRLEELNFFELDVYIPKYKIAIEYDGNVWHTDSNRDLYKDLLCQENGIHLIRIREFGLPQYETPAILIKAKRTDVHLRYLIPALEDLFKILNNLTGLNICPIIDITNDYSSILELVDKINYEQSLAVKEPEIAKGWDYIKNKTLKPEDVASASGKRVWWLCEKGHSYRAAVYQRKKCGCPYCSNKKILKGYNDLETLEPEIASEWDYEKNFPLTPDQVPVGRSSKVWWKCKKGHGWQAQISNRTNKDNRNNCPYCSGLLPWKGETDLETVFPHIAKQWNYEKNGDKKPSDFLPSSGKSVWWKCEKGHEWEAVISSRQHTGCPYCSNKRVLKGYNDLETKAPELLKDWNYAKNTVLPSEIVCGYNKKVWWKCSVCGYEWEASPNMRFYRHTGCPACTHQIVRRKVDGAIQYDSIGRPIYNDLESVRPDIARQWDYERNGELKPADVNAGSERKVWWVCDKGHHYEASIYQRATKNAGGGTNCPYCSNKKVLKGYNDLATLNPEVASEWNYQKNGDLKPSDFVISSGKRVWWKCKTCGYEWEASIVNRSSKHNKTKCPLCTHQVLVPGINDLATVYPDLLEEWDYEKNILNPHEISGGTNKKAWWICKECGHSWETSIPVRTKMNGGCPKCSAKRRGKLRSAKAKKPIIQLSLTDQFIKDWPSALEASEELNISATNIRECANGKRQSAGGFKWKYKNL